MSPRFRSLAAVVVALVAWAAPLTARAAEPEWFDPSTAPPPTAPPGTVTTTGERAGPPPLAPSPLLTDGTAASPEVNDQNPEALTKFRPYLDPYGAWVDDPTYGHVWVPSPGVVGPNFQPYVSNGRWALDQSGQWIWVSDYSFGWVVFHYGRWAWLASGSWAWIPGYQYSPAWVTWRVPTGEVDYVGWAPTPPSFIWYGGFAFWWGYPPIYPWVFCPSPYFFYYGVGYYVVTDPYWVGYAARNTRPYVPASPQPRTAASPGSYQARNPSLAAARIPSQSVPRERASAAYASDGRPLPSARTYDTGRATSSSVPTRSFDSRSVAPSRAYSPGRPGAASQRMVPTRASPGRYDMRGSPARSLPYHRR